MAKINYLELNKTLKPINKNTIKSIELNSAKFIYVNRDRVAKCERCESEFILATEKHNSFTKCPKCHKTFKVIHTWRKSNNESIHWEVMATSVSDTTLVLRYYLVRRVDGKILDSNERARLFINSDKKETFKAEKTIWNKEWHKGSNSYFKEYFMGWQTNRFCCLGATVRESFFTEISKMPQFKYFDLKSIWENGLYASSVCYISTRLDLYEKLQKVGLDSLIKADLQSYDGLDYNKNETELAKMLGMNKNNLNLLKLEPTVNAYKILKKVPNINEQTFLAYKNFPVYQLDTIERLAKQIGVTPYKVATYLTKQGASAYEMNSYLNVLSRNKYDIKDKSYSMPKDMAKEHTRILDEEERTRKEFETKKNELIKAVHDKLTSMPELREFLNGDKGFLVSVPMSEEDFVNEGKAQHNCVGGRHYTEAVAKEETLVFFIRDCGNPNASFVTMEYCNGAIVQCMYDHNERVKEGAKVYDFCSALANRLNECNVLSA